MNCLTLMYMVQQHCGNLHWVQGLPQRCKESNDILRWIQGQNQVWHDKHGKSKHFVKGQYVVPQGSED